MNICTHTKHFYAILLKWYPSAPVNKKEQYGTFRSSWTLACGLSSEAKNYLSDIIKNLQSICLVKPLPLYDSGGASLP